MYAYKQRNYASEELTLTYALCDWLKSSAEKNRVGSTSSISDDVGGKTLCIISSCRSVVTKIFATGQEKIWPSASISRIGTLQCDRVTVYRALWSSSQFSSACWHSVKAWKNIILFFCLSRPAILLEHTKYVLTKAYSCCIYWTKLLTCVQVILQPALEEHPESC